MENNYQRVTRIIGSVFPIDFSHVSDEVLENAQDFGNAVHKMVELYIKETLDFTTLDDKLKPYLEQFKKWLKDSKFKPKGVSHRIYSEKYKFTGELDLWGTEKGVLTIPDLKTTTVIPKTVGLQLSGYEILLREHLKTQAKINRRVLRLFPDKYEYLPMTRKSDMSAFLACMLITNYRKEIGL